MDFRTVINIPRSDLKITHQHKIMMLGSCFTESIGKLLHQNKFDIHINPFGILYNPQSISQSLDLLLEKKIFSRNDLFEYKGIYHSFYHHSRFSDVDADICLQNINKKLGEASSDLLKADILFITFGSSFVYELKEKSLVVGNCHKLAASQFNNYRLSVENIVTNWTHVINRLRGANPKLKIIFTVSPIRHAKDGMHENQLNKAILLLATEQLQKAISDVYYFPSYEIVLDELRDYRFFAEDMIHPNDVAIKYIWQRFSETYFLPETASVIEEWSKIYATLNHRPFNENSEEYKHFLYLSREKMAIFNKKYPYICCDTEATMLDNKMNSID